LYAIDNAHQIGVTAVATTSSSNPQQIISGGGEGEVRVWIVGQGTWKLKGAMKEKHKGKQQ